MIDPKTGLPLTPAELREREIDKFDPMKRDYDFSGAANANGAQTDQQQQQPQDQQPSGQPQSTDKPLPGSVAAMNADAAAASKSQTSGSATVEAAAGGGGGGGDSDYTGPAVLSRSYTLARPMASQEAKWTAGLSLSYSWDDGQEPVATSGQKVQYQNVTSSVIFVLAGTSPAGITGSAISWG